MWRNEDLFESLGRRVLPALRRARARGAGRRRRDRGARSPTPAATPVHLPASPLMHGTGFMSSLQALTRRRHDRHARVAHASTPHELWRAVERERVTQMAIVGDAFGKPMVRALEEAEADGTPYDLSSLGAHHLLGRDVDGRGQGGADGARRVHLPRLARLERGRRLRQQISVPGRPRRRPRSSRSASTPRCSPRTAARSSPARTRSACSPSAAPSRSATTRTRRSRRRRSGRSTDQRYSIPGDWATVAADGTIELLGRGSVSINTGGEKVFPEEVEEAVKMHPAVVDAIVVGVPDERFGEAIAAVVALRRGRRTVDADEIAGRARRRSRGSSGRATGRGRRRGAARPERQGRLRLGQGPSPRARPRRRSGVPRRWSRLSTHAGRARRRREEAVP